MASKGTGRRARAGARPEAPPGMTALDRASSVRTGMVLAALSGLLLILALLHEQVGRPFGPIVTGMLLLWGGSGAAMGVGIALLGGRRRTRS
jgi:hypothetical protein